MMKITTKIIIPRRMDIMVRFNITLEQDEMLTLLAHNSSEAFRFLLEQTLNNRNDNERR